jgi:hypothetical protein
MNKIGLLNEHVKLLMRFTHVKIHSRNYISIGIFKNHLHDWYV